MVTTTLIYAMRERAIMDDLEKIRNMCEHGLIVDFYSPHGCLWISYTPTGLQSMSNMTLALTGMQDPKINSSG